MNNNKKSAKADMVTLFPSPYEFIEKFLDDFVAWQGMIPA